MDQLHNKVNIILIYLGLALATFIAFEQVRLNGFVYDDNQYIIENEHIQDGLTPRSITWALTTSYAYNWHPLTWISHIFDYQLFGLNPSGHHLTNLLFHIVNTLLLFWVLKKMSKAMWSSVFVAAAFALHPLHVESVAWIAERKDVLSGLFLMLTIAAYIFYTKNTSFVKYLLVFFVFVLGLMAKPMIVTLPFVLLLLDYWPLNRLRWRTVLEKIPLFILTAVSCIVTYVIQQRQGATGLIKDLPVQYRLANAVVSYLRYIGKTVYPKHLAVLYPHPVDGLTMYQLIISLVVLICISGIIFYTAKHRRYLAVGWFWFIGTLVPVIGIVQVGYQAMSDRYTYLPSIGLFIIAGFSAAEIVDRWPNRKVTFGALAVLLLSGMLICTRTQVKHWQNNITLFEHAIKVTRNNAVMHNNLGTVFSKRWKMDEAISHYKKALQIEPDYALAHKNLGVVYNTRKNNSAAIIHLQKAISLEPGLNDAYYYLAKAFRSQRRFDKAEKYYRMALKFDNDKAKVFNNLGVVLNLQGKTKEAIESFRQSLQLNDDDARTHNNMAVTLESQGMLDKAIDHYRKAVQLEQDYTKAHNNLGMALKIQGKFSEALEHFRKAAYLNPNWPEPLVEMAKILSAHPDPNLRDINQAVGLVARAAELTEYQDIAILEVLASTYAAGDQFDQAVKTAETALKIASDADDEESTERISRQLQLYRNNKQ